MVNLNVPLLPIMDTRTFIVKIVVVNIHFVFTVPCSSAKPFIGTLDVPVTNCNNLALISSS